MLINRLRWIIGSKDRSPVARVQQRSFIEEANCSLLLMEILQVDMTKPKLVMTMNAMNRCEALVAVMKDATACRLAYAARTQRAG